MGIPVALQLYSVRDDAARDLFSVLEAVAEMGYDGVEFAGYYGHAAGDIRAGLDKYGLRCAGTHIMMEHLTPELESETAAFHQTIGCSNLIIPWIPEEKRNSTEACLQLSETLTEFTNRWAKRGYRVGFHVHEGDVHSFADGNNAWYLIGQNTPDEFVLQWDTSNGKSGGADPVQPLLDFPGRGYTTHLKEWTANESGVPLGQGEIPWPAVLDACERVAGTQWYIIEHEAASAMTPLESVAACREGLRTLGR